VAITEWSWKCICSTFMLLFAISGTYSATGQGATIEAIRVEDSEWAAIKDGTLLLTAEKQIPLRIIGHNISPLTVLRFTTENDVRGASCDDLPSTRKHTLEYASVEDDTSAISLIELDKDHVDDGDMHICVKELTAGGAVDEGTGWIHMGNASWLNFQVMLKPEKQTLLPMPVQIVVIIVLLFLSGLFSGLNLGLMSLDKTDLKIIGNCGSEKEKSYAKSIAPVRKRGNFLLCTILLGNVLVNNTLTILMDDLTGSGMVAVVIATMGIVIFGEIIPQAVCSRHGLAVGARTIYITKFFMFVTFPLSFPISKLLDIVLGEEIGNVYNRDRLRELLKVTEQDMDLLKDEVNIIAGALELSKKTVVDIMTKLDDVYMVEYSSALDFETMNEVIKTGYTRIPVYEKDKNNIIGLLNIKDLAFVDPDDKTPLKTVCKFYNHTVNFVFEDTKLDIMLQEFKKGRSHMSFVQRVNNEGEGDPFYETLGLVTLEDVIEEIIQAEIVDETDIISDNRRKTNVNRSERQHRDFSIFNTPDDKNYPRLSPQLALVTFQYLSTSVPPFKPELISNSILQRLTRQNIIIDFQMSKTMVDKDLIIYERGKACDFFIMILQGKAQTVIGKERLTFEAGPFMYFGTQALAGVVSSGMSKNHSTSSVSSATDSIYHRKVNYTPDFTLKCVDDLLYMKISRAHYIAAYRATMMEKEPKTPQVLDSNNVLEDPFTKEWNRAISVSSPPNQDDLDLSGSQIHVEMDSSHDDKESVTMTSPSMDGDLPTAQTPQTPSQGSRNVSVSEDNPDSCSRNVSVCEDNPDSDGPNTDTDAML
jgi:metal transporter CNNM